MKKRIIINESERQEILSKHSEFGYKTINYVELIPLLVSKIQSMQKEIDDLKEKCATRS